MSLVSYIETIAKDGGADEVEIVNVLIAEGADVNLADGVRSDIEDVLLHLCTMS